MVVFKQPIYKVDVNAKINTHDRGIDASDAEMLPLNSTNTTQNYDENFPTVVGLACILVLVIIVGLVGNLLVIWVLARSSNRLVYETFCVGLAFTDVPLITITGPVTLVQYFVKTWIFGIFWCKVLNFAIQVGANREKRDS